MDEVLEAFDAAWNERSPVARARLLERALVPDAQLVDPNEGRFQGRDAIDARIAGLDERVPGARVTITSGVDQHNGYARYAWTMTDGGGNVIVEGIDVVERAEDNRLKRVIMFFGPLPEQSRLDLTEHEA